MIASRLSPRAVRFVLAAAVAWPSAAHGQTLSNEAGLHKASASQSRQTPSARRVWADPSEDARDGGSLSPDGRFYAFASGPGAELAVRTLATGATRYLTGSRALNKTTGASAYTPVFSHDGKFIAYAWDDDTMPGYEVRVIDSGGSSARLLYRPFDGADPIPSDWSPDGRYVVATEETVDRTIRLLLLPVNGGPPRILKSFLDWQRPSNAKLSPDGKFLAYDNRPRKDAVDHHIYLLDLEGSRESAIVTGPSDDKLVGWTSDGRIVFTSDRKGSPGVWTLRLTKNNEPSEPVLIKKDLWRSAGFMLTANGTLFYSVQTGDRDVFSAAFDTGTSRLISKPIAMSGHPGEAHSVPDVSPDGRLVLYFTGSGDLRRQKYAAFGKTTITIQSLEGGQSRTLRPKLAGITDVVWANDEKSLVLQARDDKNRPQRMLLDLKSGEVRVIDYPWGPPSFSRDGKWMFGMASDGKKLADRTTRVFARRLADGAEHVVWQSTDPGWNPRGGLRSPLLSPDGRTLAFTLAFLSDTAYLQRLLVADVMSGSTRELISPASFPKNLVRPAFFTPDGKNLLFVTTELTGNLNRGATRLWRIPTAGGTPQQVEMPIKDFDLPALTPDGRRLLFTAGTVAPEYWVLEDSRLGFVGPASRAAEPNKR